MEPNMPIILPQGIVTNTANIYKEVASYPVIPADKIWEYWRVYTTTNKKIQDPTARRLENFWWQVWGSDRRNLSGRALAKIYEDISLGPTVVPLRGPPEPSDGPLAMAARIARDLAAAQANKDAAPAKSSDASFRSASTASSSSKPPPPHPILKKSRSPLVSGPRPTARFATPPPPDSTDEDDIPSSGSTATTGLEMALPPKQAVPAPLANLSFQKRPVAVRRSSPQQSSVPGHVSFPGPETPSNAETDGRPARSAKAAGKRPEAPPLTAAADSSRGNTTAGSTNTDTEMQAPDAALGMRRTASSNGGSFSRKLSAASLFTGATASTTNVAAQGTIIDQAGSLPTSSISIDQPGLASLPSPTFPAESRMTPTQPSSSARVPMGRTRSQLTLLLERDGSSNGERSRSKS